MITLGAMAVAATVSASTAAWSLSDVAAYKTGSSEGYSVLCFINSDLSGTTANYAMSSALQLLGETWSVESAATLASNAYYSNGKLDKDGAYTSSPTPANENWKKNTEVEFYAIVLNDADPSKATGYMIAGEDDGEGNIVPAYLKFGSGTANKTIYLENAAWADLKTSAVPEPTSGLLLLLGVAGLALRRRRA